MDTERYVKCGAMENMIGGWCSGKAHYWVLMDGELYMRCEKHWSILTSRNNPTFTNLQDALAALAMEWL